MCYVCVVYCLFVVSVFLLFLFVGSQQVIPESRPLVGVTVTITVTITITINSTMYYYYYYYYYYCYCYCYYCYCYYCYCYYLRRARTRCPTFSRTPPQVA